MKYSKWIRTVGLISAATVALAQAPAPKPEPDLRDVKYRPHERNVLDLWKAASDEPVPLVTLQPAPLQPTLPRLLAVSDKIPDRILHPAIFHGPPTRIAAYTLGGVRDLPGNGWFRMGLGSDLTLYSFPQALELVYGSNPVSFRIFLRFRPGNLGP